MGNDEKKLHIPNLCVVQQVCSFCVEITDIIVRCDHCGIREYVFQNNPVKQLVEFVLARRQQFKKIICIHMPLNSLPKAYGLPELEKGIYPHLFNTPQNQTYVGPLSPLSVHSPD